MQGNEPSFRRATMADEYQHTQRPGNGQDVADRVLPVDPRLVAEANDTLLHSIYGSPGQPLKGCLEQ
jgi:hypothetical protein